MSKIVVSIYEPTIERAIDAILALPDGVDMVELRADRLEPHRPLDCSPFRAVTDAEIIFTRRTCGSDRQPNWDEIDRAIDCGANWVDVEFVPSLDRQRFARVASRAILSFHDFTGAPDPAPILELMASFEPAKRKIALTPQTFRDNLLMLQRTSNALSDGNSTVIGMGGTGLYTRLIAPFLGSELIFVARDAASASAPGQLTLERTREIYGDFRHVRPRAFFAVVGNPVAHSRSPVIHNAIFRRLGLPAAYAACEATDFSELLDTFFSGEPFAPVGLSITAPFKESAAQFAASSGAHITEWAAAAGAVNTLVSLSEGIVGDNTDASAMFELLQPHLRPDSQAVVVGAGGTARAAVAALTRAGAKITVINRTEERAADLADSFEIKIGTIDDLAVAEVIVSTLPSGAEIDLGETPALRCFLDAAYAGERPVVHQLRTRGVTVIDGLQLLERQAVGQSEWFVRACHELAAAGQFNTNEEQIL